MEKEERKTLIQKIGLKEKDSLSIANKYYSLLSAISDIKLTEREVQLVAFTAIRGNISYSNNREDFCTLYKSSPPTINNMISKLKKLKLLTKDGGKIKVAPRFLIDFESNLSILINIQHG